MFEKLKRMYLDNILTLEMLNNAVTKKWITEEQKEVILNSK